MKFRMRSAALALVFFLVTWVAAIALSGGRPLPAFAGGLPADAGRRLFGSGGASTAADPEFSVIRTPTPTKTPTSTATIQFTPTPVTPTATNPPAATATATAPSRLTPTPVLTPTPTASPSPMDAVIPLMDLGTGTYKGFEGGLYPGGTNLMPEAHVETGLLRAQAIQPRDPSGTIDPDGKYIFLSIGMSNTSQEFCGNSAGDGCNEWSFIGQAASDPLINHEELVILNGATGGAVTRDWDEPDDFQYDRVRDQVLAPLGYTENQVQIVWVKTANRHPGVALPSETSDAFNTFQVLGNLLRSLQIRYPNIQQVFISSRIYAGYATTTLNPEPYAYEYGFSVKWLVEAQIDQMAGGGIHPIPGDLNYDTIAPWAAWGPYLWANGATPRSDGLIWLPEDFILFDGTHPSFSGQEKVADLLLDFFSTSPLTSCWFLAGGNCELVVQVAGADDAGWSIFSMFPKTLGWFGPK